MIEPHVEDLLLTEVASRSYRPTQETKAIEAAEREVEQATAELYAWATDQSILGLGRDMYLDGLHARQGRVDDAEARRRALFSKSVTALPSRTELRQLWPSLTQAERRKLIASAFDCVVVIANGRRPVEERVVVVGRGDGPADLPGRGKRVPFKPFDLPGDAGMAVAEDGYDGGVEGADSGRGQRAAA